jgi:hypothetical protein
MSIISTTAAAARCGVRIWQSPEAVAADLYRLRPRANSLAHLLGCECHDIRSPLTGKIDNLTRISTACPVHGPHLANLKAARKARAGATLQ